MIFNLNNKSSIRCKTRLTMTNNRNRRPRMILKSNMTVHRALTITSNPRKMRRSSLIINKNRTLMMKLSTHRMKAPKKTPQQYSKVMHRKYQMTSKIKQMGMKSHRMTIKIKINLATIWHLKTYTKKVILVILVYLILNSITNSHPNKINGKIWMEITQKLKNKHGKRNVNNYNKSV